jgi:hypothetical protein
MTNVEKNQTTALKSFLSTEAVKVGLRIDDIKKGLKAVNQSEKDSFKVAMLTAEHIGKGILWYNSPEGKVQRKLDGLKFDIAVMGREVYNLGKTQLYRYNNCYLAHVENAKIVAEYISFIALQQKAGEDESCTLKGFLKYVNEEESDEKEEAVDYPTKFVTGKGKEAIKCRMTADDVIDLQGNSVDDVLNVLEHMTAQVMKLKNKNK